MDLTSECLRAVDSSSCEDSPADLGYGQMYAQTCCLNFTPNWASHKDFRPAKNYRTQAKWTWLCRGLAFGRKAERTGDWKLLEHNKRLLNLD